MTARIGLRDEQGRAPAGLVLGMPPEVLAVFARACRMTEEEAQSLTLANRVGTLFAQEGRRRNDSLMQAATAAWISPGRTRWCPDCLRGHDDRPGYWRLSWQLPWHYACLRHRRLLHDMCPVCDNHVGQATADGPFGALVPNPGAADLPPDACRHRPADDLPFCGHRLGTPDPYGPPPPTGGALTAQERLDALLGLEGPADPEAQAVIAGEPVGLGLWIAALQGVVVLIRASLGLPGALDLGPGTLNIATYLSLPHVDTADLQHQLHTNTPPGPAGVAAALIPAAMHVLDAGSHPELSRRLAPYREPVREHRPVVWKSWLRQYPDNRTKTLLKTHTRWNGLTAAARTAAPDGLRGQHLAQRIPPPHDTHLAQYLRLGVSDTGLHTVTTVLLWQRVEPGSSRADAASALGFPEPGTIDSAVARLQQQLARAELTNAYTTTLDTLARTLADSPHIDYVARRAALADWTVSDDGWTALRATLQPLQKRDGRQPDWDLRRLVISQIVWEDLTGGDPFLSPAFRLVPDDEASRTRLRNTSIQFRRHVTNGTLPGFAAIIDGYREQISRTLTRPGRPVVSDLEIGPRAPRW